MSRKKPGNMTGTQETQTTTETQESTAQKKQKEKPSGRGIGKIRIPVAAWFFCACIFYDELLLRAFNSDVRFFGTALIPILFAAIGAGLFCYLVLSFLKPKGRYIGGIVVLALGYLMTGLEYCTKSFFRTYFSIAFMATQTGGVMRDFGSTLAEVVLSRLPVLILALAPLCVYLVFAHGSGAKIGKFRIWEDNPRRRITLGTRLALLVLLVIFQGGSILIAHLSPYVANYTYSYSANECIPHFGLATTLRLELEYAIFGSPEMPLLQVAEIEEVLTLEENVAPAEQVTLTETKEEKKVYEFNKMDIDFDVLIAADTNDTMKAMDQYFSSITPSKQNEYTGIYEGKNLILITAEAFSPYVISEELTPTLYRLSTEGYIFTDYYQPGWSLSTTGGEFASISGIIPCWVDGEVSPRLSADDYLPFTMGNQLRALGYKTLAYHNNDYDFYNRDKTHPNFGYDYYGVGNGLELKNTTEFPLSDLEMMESTVDKFIEEYLKTGVNFHTYYMTVSGHGKHNWSHAMARKNKDTAVAAFPDASEAVQAYIAANLEFEYSMEYLVNALEEAGIAEDTVIAITADHYPYTLSESSPDYYNELRGFTDTESDASRYKNSFILWCGDMEEPITIDTPCSSIDILPTLSNMFGLEYDSRLMSGHDIMATNYIISQASTCMPLVIIPTYAGYSWKTTAGYYDAPTGTFTPAGTVQVAENYVENVNKLVQAKFNYAGLMIKYDYYGHVFGKEKQQ